MYETTLNGAQKSLEIIADLWTGMADESAGGFGAVDGDGNKKFDGNKDATMHARILYAMSAAYRKTHREDCLRAAQLAFEFIRDVLWDREFGGVWQAVDAAGKPLAEEKRTYNQAFTIYGLSEFYAASGNAQALELAETLADILETARSEKPFYADFYTRNFSACCKGTLRPGNIEPEDYSLDSQSHTIEGYSNLYRVHPTEKLKKLLVEHCSKFTGVLFDTDGNKMCQALSPDFKLINDDDVFGDNMELSWFIYEMAELTGNKEIMEKAADVALKLAEHSYQYGYDTVNGGIYGRISGGKLLDTKIWWVECEAINGMINAYRISADEKWLHRTAEVWSFVEKYIIKPDGIWRGRVERDGTPFPGGWKGGVCPYHNLRTCLKLIEVLEK